MKIAAVFLLLLATSQLILADPPSNFERVGGFGEKLKQTLEKLKDLMKVGDPKHQIPVLDPLNVTHQKLEYEEGLVKLNGDVSNLHVEGLSNYTVQAADFQLTKWNVSIDLVWHNIKGNTSYNIDGFVEDKLPFYGMGNTSFEASEFRFKTSIKLKLDYKAKNVTIVKVDGTLISLQDLKMNITGLFKNEEISQVISAVISDIAPESIKDFQEELTSNVNYFIIKHGNQMLSKISLDDIMGMIAGGRS